MKTMQMAKVRAWLLAHPWVALVLVMGLSLAWRHWWLSMIGLPGFLVADFSWIGAEDAASKNQKNVRETNKQNLQMFRESRGEGGSAVLPLFLKNKDGSLFESKLGNDMIDDYSKTRSEVPDFAADRAAYQPMVAGSRRTAAGIYDGGVRKELQDNFAPVKSARVNFSRQAAVDSLSKTLGEINAMQSGKGFEDDSMGNRMMRFNANKGAADTVAGANLKNLEDERGISDATTNLKLSSLNLPYALSNENIEFDKAPHDAYIDEVMKGLQPMTFLKIGGSQPFTYQNMPQAPTNNMFSGMAGDASAGGASALSYWLKRKQAGNYNSNAGGDGAISAGDYSSNYSSAAEQGGGEPAFNPTVGGGE